MNLPKITIVTVCYNAEATIEETIKSVADQTYQNIEYLIIDGQSQDDTWKIVKKFFNLSYIRAISEKDSGLYNAMNKAIHIATGQYIIFLNSGDLFYHKDVLKNIAPYLTDDLVYGNVLRITPNGKHLEKYYGRKKEFRLLLQGKMMCHQSIFTKMEVMQKYLFDETYQITADYDFVMRMLHDKRNIKYIDQTISIVDNVEGISSSLENMHIMRMEDDRSLKANFPFWYYLMLPLKSAVRLIKVFFFEKTR